MSVLRPLKDKCHDLFGQLRIANAVHALLRRMPNATRTSDRQCASSRIYPPSMPCASLGIGSPKGCSRDPGCKERSEVEMTWLRLLAIHVEVQAMREVIYARMLSLLTTMTVPSQALMPLHQID